MIFSICIEGALTDTKQKTLWLIDNSLSMHVRDIGTNDGGFMSRLDAAI